MNNVAQNSNFRIIEGAFDSNDDRYQVLSPLSSLNTTLDGNLNGNGEMPNGMVSRKINGNSYPQFTDEEQIQSQIQYPPENKNSHNNKRRQLRCIDVFKHIETCPICSSYFKKDIKFSWILIFILVLIIIYLMSSSQKGNK